ncbi:hypothetical protein BCO_0900137 (plasmid) [Borrelia coriaceae ATCC 43381]|uniref:Uncharacterized protein n=1 Tax=Borrelia coriaceae ATCC 43381 TaxID=1408429 RepID=W5SY38_9SPIR|nr:hypothetical protein BCO_0900137 [Borrelia coriaceae ATCC 43381]
MIFYFFVCNFKDKNYGKHKAKGLPIVGAIS